MLARIRVEPPPRGSEGLMTRSRSSLRCAAAVALALAASPAFAQDRGPGFLDNLFNRDQGGSPQQQQDEASGSEVVTRLNRIESSLRQLTGTIEELQHRNQMLEQQVQQLQQRAGLGGPPAQAAPMAPPAAAPTSSPPPMAPPPQIAPPSTPGRRSDVFDPSRQPNAPGAPRPLGNESASVPPAQTPGAPLNLSTMANNQGGAPQPPASPPRNAAAPGAQLATLPPSASPQDEFDMAYGYVLHKDYGLAVQAFRDFLRRHPDERLVPDAQFWLGDALFRQQQYREAAESFLAVSTKYEHSGKAPDALLKLGQSLAELHQKEAACATLAQVGRKYPQASAGVKRAATAELKKQHC
jgi:tol-pal system protein YbgF